MNSHFSPYAKGLLITALGVLIISPDGLLTRLIAADAWTFAFWRGLLSGLTICGAVFAFHGRQGVGHLRALGKPGLLVALTFGLGSITFVYSFTHTTVANALFLFNTSPVFAALIGWYVLQDEVPVRTRVTIGAVLVGIAIITLNEGMKAGDLLGNLGALTTALMSAIGLTLARHFRHIDMVPAVGVGGFITALITLPLAAPLTIAPDRWPHLLLLGLFVLPVSFGLFYIGPRYAPAAEISLMLLLEAILGPLLVWWALGEHPGIYTLIGGVIIIAALAFNAAMALRLSKRKEYRR